MEIYEMYRERKYSTCKAKQTKFITPTKNETIIHFVYKNNEKFKYSASHQLPKTPSLLFHYQSLSKTHYHYNCSWDHRIQEFNGELEIFFLLETPLVLVIALYLGVPSISLVDFFCLLCSLFSLSVLRYWWFSPSCSSHFLGDLIHSHSFSCCLYADDSQCSSAS